MTPASNLISELLAARRISSVEVGSVYPTPPCGRVHPRYIPAIWRDITPIDPATRFAGIGFMTDVGPVFLRLDEATLDTVRDVIGEQIAQLHRTNSQSDRSVGRSRSEVRTPDEVLK